MMKQYLPLLVTTLIVVSTTGLACGKPDRPPAQASRTSLFAPSRLAPRQPPAELELPPIRVVDHSPIGAVASTVGQVRVRFNRPIVPLSAALEKSEQRLIVSDERGLVEGSAWFEEPHLLVFESDRTLSPARRYRVELRTPLTAFDGAVYSDPLTWTFETPRPTAQLVSPVNGEVDVTRDAPIFLATSLPTSADALRGFVSLEHTGAAAPFELLAASEEERQTLGFDEGRIFRLIPKAAPPVGTDVVVEVSPGWRSSVGELAATQTSLESFRIHPALEVAGFSCERGELCPIHPIELQFTTPVREGAARHVRVTPPPPGLNVEPMWKHDTTSLVIRGRFRPGMRYRVEVAPGLTDVYGQSLGERFVRDVEFEMPPPQLYFDVDRGQVADDEEPRLGISSRHVRRALVRAAPIDADAWSRLAASRGRLPNLDELADVREYEVQLNPTGPTNWASTPLDLADVVGSYRGPLVVELVPIETVGGYREDFVEVSGGAFQFTSLTAYVLTSDATDVVRTEDLVTGEAVPDVVVRAVGALDELGTTGPDGLLKTKLPKAAPPALHFASPDGDAFVLSVRRPDTRRAITWLESGEAVKGRTITERGAYRPGEPIEVVTWAAIETPHDPYGFRALPHDTEVVFELLDSTGAVLYESKTRLEGGKAWARLQIPKAARLGSALVRAAFVRDGVRAPQELAAQIRVEEYRVPEFSVSARFPKAEVVAEEAAVVDVRASYHSGGPVPIHALRATRHCRPTSGPRPPGGFTVGAPHHTFQVTTNPPITTKQLDLGRAEVTAPALDASDGQTRLCSVDVVVQSPSYQEEGASVTYVVHPAPWYLGVRRSPPDAADGALRFELAAFSLAGEPSHRDTAVDVVIHYSAGTPPRTGPFERSWIHTNPDAMDVAARCRLDLARGPGTCEVKRPKTGVYEVVATAVGEPNVRAGMIATIAADTGALPPQEDRPVVTVEPPRIAPGDPVRVVVASSEPSGVLLVERHGIRDALPFRTSGGRAEVELTSDPSWVAEMSFSAWIVKKGDPDGPYLATGRGHVEVDASSRELNVELEAPDVTPIRSRLPMKILVTDHTGTPVDARVAVWAVDEAVLQLTDYATPTVGGAFTPYSRQSVQAIDALPWVLPRFVRTRHDPYTSVLRGFGFGSFGGGAGGLGLRGTGAGGGGMSPARTNFISTPLFVADVAAKDGIAHIEFETPDNLTTFRLIAVASAPAHDPAVPLRHGSASRLLRVSAPLVARPAFPRFVRPGDVAHLGVVVETPSASAGTIDVELSIDEGPLEHVGPPRRSAPSGRAGFVRLDFPVKVTGPGEATITASARFSGDDGAVLVDRVTLPLDSRPEPTIVETVATYGTVSDDVPQSLALLPPGDVRHDYGGLTIDVTSTILGGLRDATRELVEYPYGCLEQTASRLLPLVALSDLSAYVAPDELSDTAAVRGFVDRGVARILAMQTTDGGFSYWPGGESSNVWASAYATWILLLAREAGHTIPPHDLERALDSLEATTASLAGPAAHVDPALDVRRSIIAFTLAAGGRQPMGLVTELYERRAHLPTFADAFVAMALHMLAPHDPRLGELRREMLAKITERAGTASVVEQLRYDMGDVFHSDVRANAIVLLALSRIAPDDLAPVITKLARGLLESRHGGAWRNTQENAFALLAVAAYARRFEADTPDFALRVSTDHALLVDDRWRGRTEKSRTARIPMEELMALAARDDDRLVGVSFQRQGRGRAYYRVGMTYAPAAASLPAASRGIDVQRTFRRRGHAPQAEIPEAVSAGEVFALDLQLTTRTLTRYVAIDVPLPAGLEGVNVDLGGPKVLPIDGTTGAWVSHSEIHDDRIVVFADLLQPGTHHHTVYLRATTLGEYTFPPTTAAAMYVPEISGRSKGGSISIRPAANRGLK